MSAKRKILHKNAFACLVFLPFWGISYSLSFFYLGLYFREFGVSDAQLGFLVTAGAGASIVFSFLAAPIVDRLGRRRATLIFDILGTALPFLIYALHGSFVFALAGTILSNASKVTNIGYYLLMTEDSGNGERADAFNIFNIIIIASGLLVPVAGSFVARAGLVRAERVFLFVSAAVIAGAAFGRNHFAVETAAGKAMIEKAKIGNVKNGKTKIGKRRAAILGSYEAALRFIRADRAAAAAVAANVLFYVYYLVGTNSSLYFAPFFADALGMDASLVSLVGALYSGGTLFAMLFLNPPLFRRLGPARCSIFGAALNMAGFIPLVFLRRVAPVWAMGAILVSSVGFGMLKSAIDAALATCTGDISSGGGLSAGEEARAGIYSIANLASSALGMGAGALCGLFYPSLPQFIPLISIAILALIAGLLLRANRPASQSAFSRRIS